MGLEIFADQFSATPQGAVEREGGARFEVLTSYVLVLSLDVAPLTTYDFSRVWVSISPRNTLALQSLGQSSRTQEQPLQLVVGKREMAVILTILSSALQPCCLLGQ